MTGDALTKRQGENLPKLSGKWQNLLTKIMMNENRRKKTYTHTDESLCSMKMKNNLKDGKSVFEMR